MTFLLLTYLKLLARRDLPEFSLSLLEFLSKGFSLLFGYLGLLARFFQVIICTTPGCLCPLLPLLFLFLED